MLFALNAILSTQNRTVPMIKVNLLINYVLILNIPIIHIILED